MFLLGCKAFKSVILKHQIGILITKSYVKNIFGGGVVEVESTKWRFQIVLIAKIDLILLCMCVCVGLKCK